MAEAGEPPLANPDGTVGAGRCRRRNGDQMTAAHTSTTAMHGPIGLHSHPVVAAVAHPALLVDMTAIAALP
jgi:hypothetical protein